MSNNPPIYVEAPSTLAVVLLSHEPLLFLSDDLHIIAASNSFSRAFDIDNLAILGKRLGELGDGEWGIATLTSLLKATASGSASIEAYEIDLERPNQETRHLIVDAKVLRNGEADRIRLLLAITDVTDTRAAARLKDDLLNEKAILIEEVQHRVANSLQIIASVLMQSARKVQSNEARSHLQNAHHRLMSIAAVQRQLSISRGGQVPLKAYFNLLCESLSASMIADSERLSIVVDIDDSAVEANMSISLGLIVTELVINALKHAFPDQKKGNITVSFGSKGRDWTLCVSDNGIGIPIGNAAPKAGLGTGIVAALTKNLQSSFDVRGANPGTVVTISFRGDTADHAAVTSGA